MKSPLLIPGSILLGSIFIAIGLFLGLSERSAPIETPPQPGQRQSEAAVEPEVPQTYAPTRQQEPTNPPQDVYVVAEKQIIAALAEAKTSLFIPKCWTPIVEQTPEPAQSHYSINMTFNAAGVEIARGISELRDTDSRPDVANCLRLLPIGLKIVAPHTTVAVTLPLDFP